MNAKCKLGRTALHFACRAGKKENFNVLVALDDIEIDPVTAAGVTPIMMAVESANL